MVIINPAESRRVASIDVVQVNAASALTNFRIGRRPLACFGQIALKAFVALVVRNIKVDDNVIRRKFDVVKAAGVQLGEFSRDLFPFLSGCLF